MNTPQMKTHEDTHSHNKLIPQQTHTHTHVHNSYTHTHTHTYTHTTLMKNKS